MSFDDPRHGTVTGYNRIPCRDECCKSAYTRWRKGRDWDTRNGRPRRTSTTGSRRRVEALACLGWSQAEVARRCGMNPEHMPVLLSKPMMRTRTADLIVKVYDELCMTPAPMTQASSNCRGIARRRGYVPPLSWDDIDSDPEPIAAKDDYSQREDSVDEVVVERLLTGGGRARKLTRAEASIVVQRLLDRGLSTPQIEERYGFKVERYVRLSDRGAA